MPKKTLSPGALPDAIQSHVQMWGQAIKCQRIEQRMTGAQLASKISVSTPTVSRMEKGDTGVGIGSYLHALSTIGLLAAAAPKLKHALWQQKSAQRMRPTFDEWVDSI